MFPSQYHVVGVCGVGLPTEFMQVDFVELKVTILFFMEVDFVALHQVEIHRMEFGPRHG